MKEWEKVYGESESCLHVSSFGLLIVLQLLCSIWGSLMFKLNYNFLPDLFLLAIVSRTQHGDGNKIIALN